MDNTDPKQTTNGSMWQALSLAWELGYTIAIPLVILALAGRLIDKALDSSPWFLLTGVILSIAVSTWLVYRKTKAIMGSVTEQDQGQARIAPDAEKKV